MDLWKYGQIWTLEKSLNIKWSRFLKKDSLYEFIILCFIIYWVPITNLECELIFNFVMFQSNDQSLFFYFKSPILLKNDFFINK
jgi:hypothetical protein